jgi:beta-lactamase class A
MANEREAELIAAALRPGAVDTSLFSPEFFKAVPPTQLQPILDELVGMIGAVVSVEPRDGSNYRVTTATHEVPAEIVLDTNGLIAGLMFRTPLARTATPESLIAEMRQLAPQFSLLITRNGEVLHASDADLALSAASAFKMGVLKVLRDQIDRGERQWTDVIALSAADMCLPTGVLHSWPVGSVLTLHTLAGMMISVSDNTATDALIHLLGREAIEAVLGIAPVLTTREMFTLKPESALRARYLAGNLEARRAVLAELAGMALPEPSKVERPYHPEMEWNLSARSLCALIETVADLDVMAINPGVADRAEWAHIAYKGGREGGVLNRTTALTARDGTRYVIAATWNKPDTVDDGKASALYAGLMSLLARG